jgi:CheY-like chemotaxis protein
LTPSLLTDLQVLVVDDDTDTLDFLTTVLEHSGAKVIAVASVREALEVLEQLQPDVLISDIGMPDEDGYGLISKVRALEVEQGGSIPAIALTAYASGEERRRALSSGFQIHLPKPVEPAKLIAVVANFMSISQSS